MANLRTDEVFGISNVVSAYSYVDRGKLDEALTRHLKRPNHVAIKGSSKAGKTWLRQTVVSNSLVIQCRLGKKVEDIYREALAELGVRLELSRKSTSQISGTIEASSKFGVALIGKVSAKLGLTAGRSSERETATLRQPVSDLKFIAELLRESGKRLVIEDFHYLSREERKTFAFDLKALWDFGLFVVIVGVWSESNLLLNLNHDLTGRVREESIVWSRRDLEAILDKGGSALNVQFSRAVKDRLIEDSCENAGILQRLALEVLDKAGLYELADSRVSIDNVQLAEDAAMFYAEELNTTYQSFAQSVASGVRTYPNSTGIYGHAMAVIFDASDEELISGVSIDKIFKQASQRQSRIQKGNLRTVLEKFEQLQVDDQGRGLVLSYADEKVRVVDRQLLLYRRYCTVRWPWEDLIDQSEGKEAFGGIADR